MTAVRAWAEKSNAEMYRRARPFDPPIIVQFYPALQFTSTHGLNTSIHFSIPRPSGASTRDPNRPIVGSSLIPRRLQQRQSGCGWVERDLRGPVGREGSSNTPFLRKRGNKKENPSQEQYVVRYPAAARASTSREQATISRHIKAKAAATRPLNWLKSQAGAIIVNDIGDRACKGQEE